MKVSLKWLRDYVEVPTDTKAFCDKLDLTGTGVEGVDESGRRFEGVFTSRVLAMEPHPDSDHMYVCKVDLGSANVDDDGNPEPLQIVCGAQNFHEGDHIVTATIGAVLPGDFKISKAKKRGVVSFGMNCSQTELGLGGDADGIWILPPDAPVGVPLDDYLQQSDTVLDLEITPNRPDCLSMEGMAREVGAMYRTPVADVCAGHDLVESDEATAESVDIDIRDTQRCPRYTARLIRGIKVAPSPDWLAERVAAAGSRPINNVVDITNYVLFLLGQPLHAFDFAKLAADGDDGRAHIVVRPAEDGEHFTTLDGEERELTSDMTVIATRKRAVALAGVMGGLESEVTDDTVDVLLETATFSPAHTSRTSRNLGLISESSMRYERKVDAERIARNADFAAALIAEVCGGTVCAGLVDEWPVHEDPVELTFRVPRFQAMMGAPIPKEDAVDILTRLGCTVKDAADTLNVTAPTFRPDLEREIDLYEEVLRLWGMENVQSTLPAGRGRVPQVSDDERVRAKLHTTLAACGMNQTVTYSFADPEDLERLRMQDHVPGEDVRLINPINADQSVMRRSIIPGLLRSVSYNQNHGVPDICLYEIGSVFEGHAGTKLPRERAKLAGVMAGAMTAAGWNVRPDGFDFFDGKGVVEAIARELALPKLRFKAIEADDAPWLQPGRAASVMVAGSEIGWVGEIHPLSADAFDATAPVVAFELDVKALTREMREARDYVDVPQFPAVQMDQAFVVDEAVTCEKIMQCMSSAGGRLLDRVHLFDVYRDDERVGVGKKSMAFNLEYRAADRTLTGEEVEHAHERLVKKVCGATGAEVRG